MCVAMSDNQWGWASGEIKEGSKPRKLKEGESDSYRVAGYYHVKRHRTNTLTRSEQKERLAMLGEAYFKEYEGNCNFLIQGFYEFELVHSFTFDQYVEMFSR